MQEGKQSGPLPIPAAGWFTFSSNFKTLVLREFKLAETPSKFDANGRLPGGW
jgi:hypothetical protein